MRSRSGIRILEILKRDMSDRSEPRVVKSNFINLFYWIEYKIFNVKEICGSHFIYLFIFNLVGRLFRRAPIFSFDILIETGESTGHRNGPEEQSYGQKESSKFHFL